MLNQRNSSFLFLILVYKNILLIVTELLLATFISHNIEI